jgi:hypothetical protein
MTHGSKARAPVRSALAKRSGSSHRGFRATPKKPTPPPGKSPGQKVTARKRRKLARGSA